MLRLVEPTGECDDVHELPDSANGQRYAAVCEGRHVITHPLQDNDAQESVCGKAVVTPHKRAQPSEQAQLCCVKQRRGVRLIGVVQQADLLVQPEISAVAVVTLQKLLGQKPPPFQHEAALYKIS